MEETTENRNLKRGNSAFPVQFGFKKQFTMERAPEKSNTLRMDVATKYFDPPCVTLKDTGKPLLDRHGWNDQVNLYKGADINTELDRINEHYRSQGFKSKKLLGDYGAPRQSVIHTEMSHGHMRKITMMMSPDHQQVLKEWQIDDKLQQDPYDEYYDIQISYTNRYRRNQSKQFVETIKLKSTPTGYDKYDGNVLVPIPTTSKKKILEWLQRSTSKNTTPKQQFPTRLYPTYVTPIARQSSERQLNLRDKARRVQAVTSRLTPASKNTSAADSPIQIRRKSPKRVLQHRRSTSQLSFGNASTSVFASKNSSIRTSKKKFLRRKILRKGRLSINCSAKYL